METGLQTLQLGAFEIGFESLELDTFRMIRPPFCLTQAIFSLRLLQGKWLSDCMHVRISRVCLASMAL